MLQEALIIAASCTAVSAVVGLSSRDGDWSVLCIFLTVVLATIALVLHWWNEFLATYRLEYPKCRECGYNLTGNVSGVCPECGTEIEQP